jgi:hypothetical protein
MRFSKRFKVILYTTLLILYGTGVAVWVLNSWFTVDQGLGPEPLKQVIWILRSHSTFGLWFLILFGYLFNSHVRRGWRADRKIKSGIFLISPIIFLIVTVPLLFYLTDESLKERVVWIHTYLGLVMPAPFIIHGFISRIQRS